MMGDLMAQYGCFYTGATREFSNVYNQKHCEHDLETEEKIKALWATNAKCNLPPNVGVKQFQKKRAEELKTCENNLMARFKAKSSCWITYTNSE
jgi:methyltransferase-like protein